jgi:hypothetical protein
MCPTPRFFSFTPLISVVLVIMISLNTYTSRNALVSTPVFVQCLLHALLVWLVCVGGRCVMFAFSCWSLFLFSYTYLKDIAPFLYINITNNNMAIWINTTMIVAYGWNTNVWVTFRNVGNPYILISTRLLVPMNIFHYRDSSR